MLNVAIGSEGPTANQVMPFDRHNDETLVLSELFGEINDVQADDCFLHDNERYWQRLC